MITEDLDKFVYTPAPNGLGDIQCRITRDQRGVEKNLFPIYYMHVERPGDGKKVGLSNCNTGLTAADWISSLYLLDGNVDVVQHRII